jgi:hypothetical protein
MCSLTEKKPYVIKLYEAKIYYNFLSVLNFIHFKHIINQKNIPKADSQWQKFLILHLDGIRTFYQKKRKSDEPHYSSYLKLIFHFTSNF